MARERPVLLIVWVTLGWRRTQPGTAAKRLAMILSCLPRTSRDENTGPGVCVSVWWGTHIRQLKTQHKKKNPKKKKPTRWLALEKRKAGRNPTGLPYGGRQENPACPKRQERGLWFILLARLRREEVTKIQDRLQGFHLPVFCVFFFFCFPGTG